MIFSLSPISRNLSHFKAHRSAGIAREKHPALTQYGPYKDGFERSTRRAKSEPSLMGRLFFEQGRMRPARANNAAPFDSRGEKKNERRMRHEKTKTTASGGGPVFERGHAGARGLGPRRHGRLLERDRERTFGRSAAASRP